MGMKKKEELSSSYIDRSGGIGSGVLPINQKIVDIMTAEGFDDREKVSFDHFSPEKIKQLNEWGFYYKVPGDSVFNQIEQRYLDAFEFMMNEDSNSNTETVNTENLSNRSVQDVFADGLQSSSDLDESNEFSGEYASEIEAYPNFTVSDALSEVVSSNVEEVDESDTQENNDDEENEIESVNKTDTIDESESKQDMSKEDMYAMFNQKNTISTDMDSILFNSDSASEKVNDDSELFDYKDIMLTDVGRYFSYLDKAVSIGDLSKKYENIFDEQDKGSRVLLTPMLLDIMFVAGEAIFSEKEWYYINQATIQLKTRVCLLGLCVRASVLSPKLFSIIIKDMIFDKLNSVHAKQKYEKVTDYSSIFQSDSFDNDLKALLMIDRSKNPLPLMSHISEDATQRRIETELTKMIYLLKSLFVGQFGSKSQDILSDSTNIGQFSSYFDRLTKDILASEQTRKRTNQSKHKN